MADNNETDVFKIDLDITAFLEKSLEAKGAIADLGNAESLSALTEGLLSAGAAVGAIGAAIFAWKEGFELILDAEKIAQVNQQFDILAGNAGLFGDKLKEALKDASKGWVDDVTLMQSANKALVELETGYEKIPALMELARKATQVMGGDTVQNFEAITRAVASGQTRQLRSLGLIVDQQKAYQDYAASIGVTSEELSQAGRQQAILNAVLEQSKTKFGDQIQDVRVVTNEWNKFKAQIIEFKDAFAQAFYNVVVPAANAGIAAIKKYFEFEQKAVDLGSRFVQWNKELIFGVQARASGMGELQKAENAVAQAEQKRMEAHKANPVDPAKRAKQEADVKKELAALDGQIVNEQTQYLETVEEATKAYYQSLAQEGAKVQSEIDQVRAKLAQGQITSAQANQEITRLNTLKNLKMQKDDQALWNAQDKALQRYVQNSESAFDAVGRTFKKNALEAQHDIANGMKFGEGAVKSFSQRSVSSIEAWGAGTKSATDAIEGMFAGMAGDMASQYGEMMMLAAVWPPNPPAFAAGVALVALGGFLKGIAGGGGASTPSSSAGAPGAVPTLTQDTTSAPGPAGAAAQTAVQQKSMTLIVQGHVLSGDQSARWLVEQIRNAADVTDFKIQSVGGGL